MIVDFLNFQSIYTAKSHGEYGIRKPIVLKVN